MYEHGTDRGCGVTFVNSPLKHDTVRSQSRCALRLRYGMFQACIDAREYHFQRVLKVHSDFPNADLQCVCE
jgi:hypothetical protein